MSESAEPGTLSHHLEHLAADADDVRAMLSRPHSEGGDVHPEALVKADKVATSLREVIDALLHHEHLAMSSDDVWHSMTIKHRESSGDVIT